MPGSSDRISLSARRRGPVPRDQILFLGLNPAAAQEHKALTKSGADVLDIKGSLTLESSEQIQSFVATLKLTPERASGLANLLLKAKTSGRDELAAIAQVWVRAEQGAHIPGRLVLSGHSDGLTIWSETGTASLSLGDIGRLADLFPQAAQQIEDIHISGCNTGYRSNMQLLSTHFPKLNSIWGYTHTAPAGSNGAPEHLKIWEAATRGAQTSVDRQPQVSRLGGIARADNLAIWSKTTGYQSADPGQRMEYSEIRQIVERYRLGEALSDNPQAGPLKQAYDALQSLRGESSPGSYDELIGQALRLRFHQTIAGNFERAYGETVIQAYRRLDLIAPDFSQIDRREALRSIESFNQALDKQRAIMAPEQLTTLEKVETLLHHYGRMSPEFFPPEWTDPLTEGGVAQAKVAFEALEALPDMPLFGLPGLPNLNLGDFMLQPLQPGIGQGLNPGLQNRRPNPVLLGPELRFQLDQFVTSPGADN